MAREEDDTEVRRVEVDDPALSPRAREVLTDELQEAVGASEVRVPRSTPHREREVMAHHRARPLNRDPLLTAIVLFGAIATGGVISVVVDEWWILLVAVGVHAAGTLAVGATVLQLTTQPEASDPAVTAMLEDEGVPAPEKRFNELVEEFSGATEAHGAAEVVGAGPNDRSTDGEGAKAVEQQSAMTPTHGPSEASGSGSTRLQAVVAAILVVFSFAVVLVEPGRGWIAPLLIVPTAVAWMLLLRLTDRKAADRAPDAGDDHAERRRLITIAAGCWAGIELLVLVVVVLAAATT